MHAMRPCSCPWPYPTPPPCPSPTPHPSQTTTPALVLLPLDGCLANHNGQRSFTLSLNWMCLNLLQISSIEVEQHGYPLNLLQILTTITNLPTLRNKTSIMCVHRPLVVTVLFPTQIYDTSFSYPTLSHTPRLTPTLSLGIGAHCVWPGFLAEIVLSDK